MALFPSPYANVPDDEGDRRPDLSAVKAAVQQEGPIPSSREEEWMSDEQAAYLRRRSQGEGVTQIVQTGDSGKFARGLFVTIVVLGILTWLYLGMPL